MNGNTIPWLGTFLKREEGLKASSPLCSSTYVMWLLYTWSKFEPTTWESRECEEPTGGADWLSKSWYKESRCVDHRG